MFPFNWFSSTLQSIFAIRVVSCGSVVFAITLRLEIFACRSRERKTKRFTCARAARKSFPKKANDASLVSSNSLSVSCNDMPFIVIFPAARIRPMSRFLMDDKRVFNRRSASIVPLMVTFFCKGNVCANEVKSIFDFVLNVITGSPSKSSTLASAKISVCAPRKRKIFKSACEGFWRARSTNA